jgi:RHS repeat-associated protein
MRLVTFFPKLFVFLGLIFQFNNLIEKTTSAGTVKYEYTGDNRLQGVYYPDDTSVEYTYDAFRRKASRTQTFYDLKGMDQGGKTQGKAKSKGNGKGNGKGQEKGNNGKGKSHAINQGKGKKVGLQRQMENPYADLLKTEETQYLYDGMNVFKEYGEHSEPLAQYYMGNGEVIARQMFGLHGRKQQGYEGNIQTRGGLMYYQHDGLGNVMDITDRIGDTVMKYRYDAFGNLFTQMAAPYNAVGYTGQTYDAKASLMDYKARWYSPNYGRFTTMDTFSGWMDDPLSLNRYSYVHNNPVNFTDPTGHWQEGDENLSEDAQDNLIDLTEDWHNADTQEERDRIHEEAEAIRRCEETNSCNWHQNDDNEDYDPGPTLQERIGIRKQAYNNTVGRPAYAFGGITNNSKYISEAINWTAKNTELYRVRINTFIPDDYFIESLNTGKGDNRGLFEEGTSRTSHTMWIDTMSGNVVDEYKHTSSSHVRINIPFTENDIEREISAPDGSTLTSELLNSKKNITLNMSNNEASAALKWTDLTITYDFRINLYNDGRSPTVKGTHDGFPGYEVLIDSPSGKKYGFGFNPRDNTQTIGSLWGNEGEWSVDYPNNLSDVYEERN